MSEQSKVIEILDPQKGLIKETVGTQLTIRTEDKEVEDARIKKFLEARPEFASYKMGQFVSLKEAATTSEFPALLRLGLKQILFDSYNMTPTTFQDWVSSEPSDKPAEDWLELQRLGTLPIVSENDPYPDINPTIDRTLRIVNNKYGNTFYITEEMIRFDKSNQMNISSAPSAMVGENTPLNGEWCESKSRTNQNA